MYEKVPPVVNIDVPLNTIFVFSVTIFIFIMNCFVMSDSAMLLILCLKISV